MAGSLSIYMVLPHGTATIEYSSYANRWVPKLQVNKVIRRGLDPITMFRRWASWKSWVVGVYLWNAVLVKGLLRRAKLGPDSLCVLVCQVLLHCHCHPPASPGRCLAQGRLTLTWTVTLQNLEPKQTSFTDKELALGI